VTDITSSVILPVHNQADHIAEIVQSYLSALAEVPGSHEIILVTNACSDNSPEVCQSLARGNGDSVKSIDTKNGGWGLSIKLGLKEARGRLLCYTNSARTSPETLALSIQYALNNPNAVVKANRKIRESWRRRLGSLIYNLECRTFFDLSTWDINGTPKVFPRQLEKLLTLTRDDDLIDAEFNAVCRRENYAVIEVPVFSTKRHGGKSTTNYKSALKLYWGAYELWRSMGQRPDQQ